MFADFLIPLFFWLSIPLSLTLSVIGVWKSRFWLVLIGAVLLFPVSYYLNGSPTFHGFMIWLPAFPVGSAAAVKERNKVWAWLLLLPVFFAVFWFLGAILFYQFS